MTTLEQAEEFFNRGKFAQATTKYNEVLKNPFAPPRDLSVVECRLGIIHSINLKYAESKTLLSNSLKSGALPTNQVSICSYALLQLHVLNNENTQARDLIKNLNEPSLAPVYAARMWALGAEVGRRLRDNRLEVLYLQKLLKVMEKSKINVVDLKILGDKKISFVEVKTRLGLEDHKINGKKQHRLASNLLDPADGQRTPSSFAQLSTPGESPKEESSAITIAPPANKMLLEVFKLISLGNLTGALSNTEKLKSRQELQSALESLGLDILDEKFLKRLQALSKDDPRVLRIGILVPSETVFSKFNLRLLKGISSYMASVANNGVSFQYVIKAAPNTIGAAEKAVEELLFDDHVHAVIGSISSTQIIGQIALTQILSVPVFPVGPIASSKETSGLNIIRLGVLATSQAKALISHLKGEVGFKNAAILASGDPFGFEMAEAFSTEAFKVNFPIIARQYFNPSGRVYQEEVSAILGPQDHKSRQAEYNELTKNLKEKAKLSKRKFNPKDVKLPAEVRFDALFIPDSLARAKIISSTFAYNEARSVHYLGDAQWLEAATGQASLADEFLNSARVPVLVAGPFFAHLKTDLALENALDLERQAFDALIFLRQAQYKVSGNNTGLMVRAMRTPTWSAEGITNYGPIDEKGEPATQFIMANYKSGNITSRLERWPLDKPETQIKARGKKD